MNKRQIKKRNKDIQERLLFVDNHLFGFYSESKDYIKRNLLKIYIKKYRHFRIAKRYETFFIAVDCPEKESIHYGALTKFQYNKLYVLRPISNNI
jgi:hypothetical protein